MATSRSLCFTFDILQIHITFKMRLLTRLSACVITRGIVWNSTSHRYISRASVSTLHAKINSPPPRIVKSEGSWLQTNTGHRILDASSGAAVVSIGHNDSRVKAAITAQLDQVAYCYNPFFTTEAAEKISGFLTDSTNGQMSKVFVVSSG
jgi:adenosylmethionine-8-amino-7-oxononanoate aminotransferase